MAEQASLGCACCPRARHCPITALSPPPPRTPSLQSQPLQHFKWCKTKRATLWRNGKASTHLSSTGEEPNLRLSLQVRMLHGALSCVCTLFTVDPSTVVDNVDKKLQCQTCFERFTTAKALRNHRAGITTDVYGECHVFIPTSPPPASQYRQRHLEGSAIGTSPSANT